MVSLHKNIHFEMGFVPNAIDAVKAIGARENELSRGKGFFGSRVRDRDAQGSTFTQSQFPARP